MFLKKLQEILSTIIGECLGWPRVTHRASTPLVHSACCSYIIVEKTLDTKILLHFLWKEFAFRYENTVSLSMKMSKVLIYEYYMIGYLIYCMMQHWLYPSYTDIYSSEGWRHRLAWLDNMKSNVVNNHNDTMMIWHMVGFMWCNFYCTPVTLGDPSNKAPFPVSVPTAPALIHGSHLLSYNSHNNAGMIIGCCNNNNNNDNSKIITVSSLNTQVLFVVIQ